MKINECIILAGGLGTRLRSAVPDLPKCMAPVNGKPFIGYVIEYLQSQGIEKFIFSLGYKSEALTDFISTQYSTLNTQFSIEEEPLGTGGAVKLACRKAFSKNITVTNGDTLFKIDINNLAAFHFMCGADCTLSLKPMKNFDRYGVVELKKDYSIQSFKEKNFYEEGLINGGLYALNIENFLSENLPEKFSFEKDYLEKFYAARRMYGVVQDEYFIDIGIPEDYKRAQVELKNNMLDLSAIDKSWTLFIDRDGVFNHEKKDGYILNVNEYIFYDEVLPVVKKLHEIFGIIIMVTNQKGIGKKLMTENDFHSISEHMLAEIKKHGGRIDKIYFAPDLDNNAINRKPNAGMALQAKKDFPEIDFSKSIMVGNKLSDMQFGRNANMYTVFLSTTNPETPFPHLLIDVRFDDLSQFTQALNG
jgi:D-glycero-alpha-D-manno-heptose 1-phosphate guanylyltransferase